jgi:hypothetical protein
MSVRSTNHLPTDIDLFFQDILQMWEGLTYQDIENFHPTKEQLAEIRRIHGDEYCEVADTDPEEAQKAIDKICVIVKT